jgi:hypothetical protein
VRLHAGRLDHAWEAFEGMIPKDASINKSFHQLVDIAKTKALNRVYVDQLEHARFISHCVRYRNSNPSTYLDQIHPYESTPDPLTSERR